MRETDEWLYDYYAEPQLQKLPEFDSERLERLAEAAPELTRIDLLDRLYALRLAWCTAAFESGVRLGLRMME